MKHVRFAEKWDVCVIRGPQENWDDLIEAVAVTVIYEGNALPINLLILSYLIVHMSVLYSVATCYFLINLPRISC